MVRGRPHSAYSGVKTRHYNGLSPPGRFERISPSGLLKWLNTPYRPALPDQGLGDDRPARSLTGSLGRSQAVRQRILIPPFGGSIPPAPASKRLTL
jgi:hypothetical protein